MVAKHSYDSCAELNRIDRVKPYENQNQDPEDGEDVFKCEDLYCQLEKLKGGCTDIILTQSIRAKRNSTEAEVDAILMLFQKLFHFKKKNDLSVRITLSALPIKKLEINVILYPSLLAAFLNIRKAVLCRNI